jgi:prevent-host-death family protein
MARGSETEEAIMPTVTVQEAQARLADLIHRLTHGEEVVITENTEPVAKLTRIESKKHLPRQAGSAKGKIWMAPDFDEPLEDFKEYMECPACCWIPTFFFPGPLIPATTQARIGTPGSTQPAPRGRRHTSRK